MGDSFRVMGMASRGTASGSVSYLYPVGTRGLKVGFNYLRNAVEIVNGVMSEIETRSDSEMVELSALYPLHVGERGKTEAFLQLRRQRSNTDLAGSRYYDSRTNGIIVGCNFLHYGNGEAFYARQGVNFGSFEDHNAFSGEILSDNRFSKYELQSLYQRACGGGRLLTLKLNAQLGLDGRPIPAAEQFYLGGMYSVKGYEENVVGGERGAYLGLEYAVPGGNRLQWLGFLDFGCIGGDSDYDVHTIASVGVGLRYMIGKEATATFYLGAPLRRDLEYMRADAVRAHFSVQAFL